MNSKCKDLIRKNYVLLCNDLNVDNYFISFFDAKEIFTKNMVEEIMSHKKRHEIAISFLNLIQKRPDSFETFISALVATNQKNIARMLGWNGDSDESKELPEILPIRGFIQDLCMERRRNSIFDHKSRLSRSSLVLNSSFNLEGDDMKSSFDAFLKETDPKIEIQIPNLSKSLNGFVISGDDAYPMNSNPRGLCIIVENIEFTDPSLARRDGSEHDSQMCNSLFKYLGFMVKYHKNLTTEEIESILRNYSQDDDLLEPLDSLILIVLSHGRNGTICGVDGSDMPLALISEMFNKDHCVALADKPKIFIIQGCQGEIKDGYSFNSSNMVITPSRKASMTSSWDRIQAGTKADMFMAISSVPGFVSVRNISRGGWFVNAIVFVFMKLAWRDDLLTLFTKVNNLIGDKVTIDGVSQTSAFMTTMRKLFYFNPPGSME